MQGALNCQSDRTVRYEQRCLKKKCEDQKIARSKRLEKRNESRSSISNEVSKDISSEVSNHIIGLESKHKRMSGRTRQSRVFFDCY